LGCHEKSSTISYSKSGCCVIVWEKRATRVRRRKRIPNCEKLYKQKHFECMF
jgi:hypothetical protein